MNSSTLILVNQGTTKSHWQQKEESQMTEESCGDVSLVEYGRLFKDIWLKFSINFSHYVY